MKIKNGSVYWVCICKQVQARSTYCSACSHKPGQLAKVLRRKHFWVSKKAFFKDCFRVSEKDAHLKLENIRLANKAFIAHKNRGVFGSPQVSAPRVDPRYRDIKSHYFSNPVTAKIDESSSGIKPMNQQISIDPPIFVHEKADEIVRPKTDSFSEGERFETPEAQVSKNRVTKPSPALELDPENFEWYCAEWCVYFGHRNIRVTRSTKDGGIDVHGDGFIAQVKLQELPVGVRAIRELAGLASIRSNVLAYFFCVNGYSLQAVAEANELGIAIFVVRPFQAEIIPKSEMANLIIDDARLASHS